MDSSPLASMSQAVATASARLTASGSGPRREQHLQRGLVGAHRGEGQVAVVEQVQVGHRQVREVRRGAGGLDLGDADPLEAAVGRGA